LTFDNVDVFEQGNGKPLMMALRNAQSKHLNWLRGHPQRAHACRLESEENYVAQAFERFWQATASYQRVDFNTLAAALPLSAAKG